MMYYSKFSFAKSNSSGPVYSWGEAVEEEKHQQIRGALLGFQENTRTRRYRFGGLNEDKAKKSNNTPDTQS